MARKRYSDEDALKILREIDVHLRDGLDVVSACRKQVSRTKPITIGARSLVVLVVLSFPR
jgi:hypothetical protein